MFFFIIILERTNYDTTVYNLNKVLYASNNHRGCSTTVSIRYLLTNNVLEAKGIIHCMSNKLVSFGTWMI